jgi:predicted GNAT family acetyltransferase
MRLLRLPSAAAFEAAAGSWLAADDRTNNLILSRLHAARFSDDVKSWLAVDGEVPQLALLETPLDLVLSAGSVPGAEFLADNLEAEVRQLVGPAAVADAFAARVQRKTGRAGSVSMEMTFYTLDRVAAFRSPAGCMRAATRAELEELGPLAVAAERKIGVHAEERDPAAIESTLRQAIDDGQQFVWAEGPSIRAMASYVSPFKNAGARIRGVYTLPEFRGRGYGSAITAALAAELLDGGQAWVALFADNANPTSTGIYRRLGFQAHSIFRTWRLHYNSQ